MKCFYIFKDKSKNMKGKANLAPELGGQRKSDIPSSSRTAKSLPCPRSIPELYNVSEHNLQVFSFQELRKATTGFNRLLTIGEGGFGSVYKGTIRPANGQGDPIVVAIKKLNNHGLQGHKQWLAEVQFLRVVSHPNVVKLIGYCSVDGERGIQRLLVYEYMPKGSLEDHLFRRGLPNLPWRKRLEIILGAAEGLAYLHGGMEVQVIYRDFKSSNVLLDEDFKPKLSDFGLAREGPTGDRTHVSTAVLGTYGYAAPEYLETGHLTSQSDIWSFGVVLYEILTGRRTVETNRPAAEQKLLYWVKQFPVDSSRFSMIIDPRLRNEYSIKAARQIAKLADSCLNKNAKERPAMTQVVASLKQIIQDLEGGSTSTNKNIAESSQSSLFRRRQNKV
ncbi:probable serine/threonine-protein kinase PBL19 isoform X2 [Populus trichocarpa]|uniref:probable serine/threonine-protein kinase PBL19 isoform X2 n=1 Tax=Populus trichocarpa TaxID=3694 RepID=UPI0022775842|nr:probable serine/threonine-protein kinase PBL19 isoform X2 [Populus trichocarpa]